jgi:hypothetical protein
VDLNLIVEGGRRTQPSKRVQGMAYPEMITQPRKKTGQIEGQLHPTYLKYKTYLHNSRSY